MLISKFATYNDDDKVTEMEEQYNIILPGQYKSFLSKEALIKAGLW